MLKNMRTAHSWFTYSECKCQKEIKSLDTKQQSIIKIASFTANGDLKKLDTALILALENGLSINEINEVLVHSYAYVGFPKKYRRDDGIFRYCWKKTKKWYKRYCRQRGNNFAKDMDKNAYGARVRAQLVGLPKDPESRLQSFFA